MRRRLSLALLAVLVVLAVFAVARHRSAGNQAARADSGQEVDTMCFASRIGLPCNPN